MSVLLFTSIFSNLGLLPTDVKNISKKAIRIAEMQPDYPEYQGEISRRTILEEDKKKEKREDESTKSIQEVEEKGFPDFPEQK